ncbi:MAG: hypothetical protein HYZ83_06730 [Candidatus Omnitrophica bacterium]|nr:hypothetical protein [Candidatus Omnitrophota bacterium]
MNILKIAVFGAMVLTGMSLNQVIWAEEDAADYHEKLALSYEKKAADQNEVIAEHQQMKKSYRQKFMVNPKFGPPAKVQEMEKHCDAIMGEAGKLKNEFLEFSKWHGMRAAELKGQ